MARPISEKTKQKIANSKYAKKTNRQSVMYNLQEEELYEFVLKNGSGNFLKYLANKEFERWKSIDLDRCQGLILDGYYEKTPWKIYRNGEVYEIELGVDRLNKACYGKSDMELGIHGKPVKAEQVGEYWNITLACDGCEGWDTERLVAKTYDAIGKLIELKRGL